ncbi:MAG: hypothetical protein CR217_04605 [Beijerinckiaceae bacterium]|nr:MAG: hypothetical protein CR217_04605 [Beijerinckiaceae bacterium]
MHGSRPAYWRRRRCEAALRLIVLTVTLEAASLVAAEQKSDLTERNWPCHQILVGQLSLAAVWSGPSIEGLAWRNDQAVADIVATLAARRTPLEAAERAIEDFAQSQGASKTKKLVAVFAGLFETLNDERTQVIAGLLRFGAKQKELAGKIRTENARSREAPGKEPRASRQGEETVARDLEWDLRVFDERRQSLTYVCETPALIEQRLFALARVIQRRLE